jgi:hypothetical protein
MLLSVIFLPFSLNLAHAWCTVSLTTQEMCHFADPMLKKLVLLVDLFEVDPFSRIDWTVKIP